MKKRALARSTGSAGRILEEGYKSPMNSTRISDSANLVDSGEGFSGGTSGPPYAIAGTYHESTSKCDHFAVAAHTLLAGFTFGAYHSGLFARSISYLLNGAPTSARAISV